LRYFIRKLKFFYLSDRLLPEERVDLLSCLTAAGHSAYHEGGTVGTVATDEDVGRIFRMLRLEKTHSQQNQLGLDDFGFALFYHNGTTTFGVGLPVDFLNFHASELAVFAEELKGVDVPAAGAAFLMRRGGLEGAGPFGPRILRILGAFDGAGHDLNLSHALAALTMGGTNAVGASVATTNDEDIFALGCDALILAELHTSEDAVLLREQVEGEVYTFQFAAWGFEISGDRGA
jgi:hypothetical protein